MKPIIGISGDIAPDPQERTGGRRICLNWNYAQAIVDAGGVPFIIAPQADMSVIGLLIDGWLIPGGNDIDAARFGEANHEKVELQEPARYEGEAKLLELLDKDVPVLGICYGCQFLNVARGGNLIQHLPDVVNHESHAGGTREIYAIGESKLRAATGVETIEGKSYHHQAVKELGSSLIAVAEAADGTIEAIEATDRPWMIGVQWHPERTREDPATRRLFESFVAAARQYAESKRLAGAR